MNQMNRRGFFTRIAQISGLAILTPVVLESVLTSTAKAEQKRPSRPDAGGTPAAAAAGALIDPNDATAKAVGYVEDHTKSPASKGNHCSTCGFYTKKENKNGKEAGACTIFPGKSVYGNAFCNSWNKKS